MTATVTSEYDWAFAGAGAGSLHLLYALHLRGGLADRKVLILDPDPKSQNDRTWCFWCRPEEPVWQMFGHLCSHSWQRLRHSNGQISSLSPMFYAHLRSLDFYEHIKEILRQYPGIEWKRGSVENLKKESHHVAISSDWGSFRAGLVFDNRPPLARVPSREMLWQSFVGWRIRLSRPALDPEVCTMMDFSVAQMGATQFMYVLPFSENEALVELTRFGANSLNEAEAESELRKYIAQHWDAADFDIMEKEVNRIPMTLELNNLEKKDLRPGGIVPLGTAAGAVKASSGFAFKYMAAHANQLADGLLHQTAILPLLRKARFSFYDRIMMRVMAREPQYGQVIFKRLFQKVKTPRVLAFLDEKSTFLTELQIIAVMPPAPFLRSLRSILMGNKSIGVTQPESPESSKGGN